MDADIREVLRQFGTDEVDHFGRPLTEHLMETSRWLQKWGNPMTLSLAGAFHSIYGTEEFRQKTLPLDRRSDVRAVIGAEAEALAYLFCFANRHSLFEQADAGPFEIPLPSLGYSTEVSTETYTALIELEAANIIDQALHQPNAPARAGPFWLARFDFKAAFLSEGAKVDCRQVLGSLGPTV
ncbi:hypothetical protein HHL24_07885 [Paraburkholderia sp. RP-4-7]|jgi:hypothetical protein|uniref:DUF6817 domain-containing protein n=1 Tax=Paraburkholderia polaris TaxID=2728848 RepID=A0A848I651_9BURK|nr:hypothetical protein [Paraburkholderia polaris]NML97867.1 hypothetical protein [Paraburkholderia polaris]